MYDNDTSVDKKTYPRDTTTSVLLTIGYIIAGAVIAYFVYFFADIIITMVTTPEGESQFGTALGIVLFIVYGLIGAGINVIPTILGAVSIKLCSSRNLSPLKRTLSKLLTFLSIPIMIILVIAAYIIAGTL